MIKHIKTVQHKSTSKQNNNKVHQNRTTIKYIKNIKNIKKKGAANENTSI